MFILSDIAVYNLLLLFIYSEKRKKARDENGSESKKEDDARSIEEGEDDEDDYMDDEMQGEDAIVKGVYLFINIYLCHHQRFGNVFKSVKKQIFSNYINNHIIYYQDFNIFLDNGHKTF